MHNPHTNNIFVGMVNDVWRPLCVQVHEITAADGKLMRVIIDCYGDGDSQLHHATSLALSQDGGVLFVADGLKHRVCAFSAHTGEFIRFFQAPGGMPACTQAFVMQVTSSGIIYIADAAVGSVQVIAADGTHIHTIGSALSRAERYDSPTCIALSPDEQELYVCDNQHQRIQVYSSLYSEDYELKRNLEIRTVLSYPTRVCVSPDGAYVIVEDQPQRGRRSKPGPINRRIRVLNSCSGLLVCTYTVQHAVTSEHVSNHISVTSNGNILAITDAEPPAVVLISASSTS
jgi:DNA-binding beta-propeller fold protein YncE